LAIGNVDNLYVKLQGDASKLRDKGAYSQAVELYQRAIALEQATNKQPNILAWLNYWIGQTYYLWKK
jgi:hypothetical protein